MKIDLYESGAGHLWMHPNAIIRMILMDWDASFANDARTFGDTWDDSMCMDDCVPFEDRGLHLIATYDQGKVEARAEGASREARLYIKNKEHAPQKGS